MPRKKCKICGKNAESEFCFIHKPKKPLKKSGAFLSRRQNEDIEEGQMWELFMEIKRERVDKGGWLYCFETGEKIPKNYYNTTLIYHHLFEKGVARWEKYKYEKWNIYIVHPDVHTQIHADIDKTPRLKEERERLIKEKSL